MKTITLFSNFTSKLSNHAKKANDRIYQNPCLDLQRYLEIPLFKENEISFTPNLNAMISAENLFVPKSGHAISLISKAVHPEKYPDDSIPEVAFLGKSNVGKSSLLKAIFRNVPDLFVKTSKKPGHTKSLQFFQVGTKLRLVDMPGYGYREPTYYKSAVHYYLQNRKNLRKTFLLVDGEIGIKEIDNLSIKFLEEYKIPYCVILTKIDKANDSQRLRNLLHYQNIRNEYGFACCFPQPFMLSSMTYEGLSYFLAFLGHITGNIKLNE